MDTSKGSHTFKMGAEMFKERSWEGFESRRGGDSNLEHRFNNGAATQVIFGFPTADCAVGTLAAHDCLKGQAALDVFGLFLTDTWAVGKHDRQRRRALRPLQGLAAGAGPDGGHRSRLGRASRRWPRRCRRRASHSATSTPGTRSRRASAWSMT